MDTTNAPAKSFLRRSGTVLGTGAILAMSAALAVGGAMLISERAEAVVAPEPVPPVSVTTSIAEWSESYEISRTFIGQVEPRQQTSLGFEAGGTVVEVLFDEGQRVQKGEALAVLDRRSLEAQMRQLLANRAALEARAELNRATAERQNALSERGFASDQRIDEAQFALVETLARIEEINAAVQSVEIALDKSVLRAPFDAEISSRQIDTGQTVSSGQPVFQLLEAAAPRMRVGLPLDLAQGFGAGHEVTVEFANGPIEAQVLKLRPEIDALTRTRDLILAFDSNEAAIAGQIGDVALRQDIRSAGIWLPVSALSTGPNATWRVFGVVEEGGVQTVSPYAVEILHSDGQRVYLRGAIPAGVPIVSDGVHRLVPGQPVTLSEGEV